MFGRPTTGRPGLRQTHNFALQHLKSTAAFARRCDQIEKEHENEEFGSFFEEIRSLVSAGVITAVAAMEANLNELVDNDRQTLGDGFKDWCKGIDRKPMVIKYKWVLAYIDREESIPRDVCENAEVLVRMRNCLIHYRPVTSGDGVNENDFDRELVGRFERSPFVPRSSPLFPTGCMSKSCLKWAVDTSFNFMKEFSLRSRLQFKFENRERELSTDYNRKETGNQ